MYSVSKEYPEIKKFERGELLLTWKFIPGFGDSHTHWSSLSGRYIQIFFCHRHSTKLERYYHRSMFQASCVWHTFMCVVLLVFLVWFGAWYKAHAVNFRESPYKNKAAVACLCCGLLLAYSSENDDDHSMFPILCFQWKHIQFFFPSNISPDDSREFQHRCSHLFQLSQVLYLSPPSSSSRRRSCRRRSTFGSHIIL